MTSLLTPVVLAGILAVVEGPDPEDVKAGWVAFGIFLALAAAVALLGRSLSKHLKRVDFEEVERPRRAGGSGAEPRDRPAS